MSSARQNLSDAKVVNTSGIDHFHFTIIVSEWNSDITSSMEKACCDTLIASGAKKTQIDILYVPGSWELISAARITAEKRKTNAIICIGCVIRGETPHFEYISQGVTFGLANLCSNQGIPIIYGILTVENHQQACDRSGGLHGNKGTEAAFTAIKMIQLCQPG